MSSKQKAGPSSIEDLITICLQKKCGANNSKAAHLKQQQDGEERMECECSHSTGKLSTGTRQEQICVSQNEKRAICGEKSCCTEGREAAERRRAQVHVQLEGKREQGGCSPV